MSTLLPRFVFIHSWQIPVRLHYGCCERVSRCTGCDLDDLGVLSLWSHFNELIWLSLWNIYIYIYIRTTIIHSHSLGLCLTHTHTDTHLTCTRLWCRLEKKAFINKWAAPRRRDVFLLSLFHPPIHISVTCSSSWYLWSLPTLYCYLGGLRLLVYLFVFRTVWGTIQLNNGRYSNVAFAVHVLFSHSVQVDIRFLGSAIDYHLIFNFQFFA